MILYLSSAISDKRFAELLADGHISGGHQAQKFNSLIIKGLANYTNVKAVANLPYNANAGDIQTIEENFNNIQYVCLGTHKGKLHKIKNFTEMYNRAKVFCKQEKPQAIICDAINPLASLTCIRLGNKLNIPKIAIITDIPEYMDANKKTIFTKITSKLMKRYDGYILLTEAMNPLVNQKGKPYIIMEGLCDGEEKFNDEVKTVSIDRLLCVYTGSLSKGTGIEELVAAVKEVNKTDSTVELHIYGNGDLADTLQQMAQEYPCIKYKGIVSNQEAVIAQKSADLLINPRPADISYGHVSFPSKIMEYMVSGTPVLTTHLPGIPEEYFEYLYTIDDYSAEGIFSAILEVSRKSRQERIDIGKKAREFVLHKKNNKKQAERILSLIGEIANE